MSKRQGVLLAGLVMWGLALATFLQRLLTPAMALPIVAGATGIGIVAVMLGPRSRWFLTVGVVLAAALYASLAHAVRFVEGERPPAVECVVSVFTWAIVAFAAAACVLAIAKEAH